MQKKSLRYLKPKQIVYEDSFSLDQITYNQQHQNPSPKKLHPHLQKTPKQSIDSTIIINNSNNNLTPYKEKNDTLSALISKIKCDFILKYSKFGSKDYSKLLINALVFKKKSHILSKYKEHLFIYKNKEYLNRYFSINESYNRLPKCENYFRHHNLLLMKPIFCSSEINYMILVSSKLKASNYYAMTYGKNNKGKKESKVKDDNDIIFNNDIKESIDNFDNYSTSITYESNDKLVIFPCEILKNSHNKKDKLNDMDNNLNKIINLSDFSESAIPFNDNINENKVQNYKYKYKNKNNKGDYPMKTQVQCEEKEDKINNVSLLDCSSILGILNEDGKIKENNPDLINNNVKKVKSINKIKIKNGHIMNNLNHVNNLNSINKNLNGNHLQTTIQLNNLKPKNLPLASNNNEAIKKKDTCFYALKKIIKTSINNNRRKCISTGKKNKFSFINGVNDKYSKIDFIRKKNQIKNNNINNLLNSNTLITNTTNILNSNNLTNTINNNVTGVNNNQNLIMLNKKQTHNNHVICISNPTLANDVQNKYGTINSVVNININRNKHKQENNKVTSVTVSNIATNSSNNLVKKIKKSSVFRLVKPNNNNLCSNSNSNNFKGSIIYSNEQNLILSNLIKKNKMDLKIEKRNISKNNSNNIFAKIHYRGKNVYNNHSGNIFSK